MNSQHGQNKGDSDINNKSGKGDIQVKLKEDRVPLSRAKAFFQGMDQGAIIAIIVQLKMETGATLEDPILKVWRAPTRGGAAAKAFYEAMIPPTQAGEVQLTSYINDGQYAYITGDAQIATMTKQPTWLSQIAQAFAGVQNTMKQRPSQRIFFAGIPGGDAMAFGADLITVVGLSHSRWAQITHVNKPGLVIAELFRDDQGGDKIMAYRTDDQGRRIELVMANVDEIHRSPSLLNLAADHRWQLITGIPKGFNGTFAWAGRFRRTEPGGMTRTAMMGLAPGKVVPMTLNVMQGTAEFGRIADVKHIPVTSFRFGSDQPQIALQHRDASGTWITVGATSDVPAYRAILDATSATHSER